MKLQAEFRKVTDRVKRAVTKRHRERHIELHRALDELAADWAAHQPLNSGKLFSNTSIMELIEWELPADPGAGGLMKIDRLTLSTTAADGLIQWAEYQYGDSLFFDGVGSIPQEWAWVCFQLRVADDKPEWFPKGKSATIQVIEQALYETAQAEKRK